MARRELANDAIAISSERLVSQPSSFSAPRHSAEKLSITKSSFNPCSCATTRLGSGPHLGKAGPLVPMPSLKRYEHVRISDIKGFLFSRWPLLMDRDGRTGWCPAYECFSPCSKAGSNVEIKICLGEKIDEADNELNHVYTTIMSALNKRGRGHLREAQRAWMTDRDHLCESEAAAYYRYSGYGIVLYSCREAFIRQRITFLKDGFWWQVEKAEEGKRYSEGGQLKSSQRSD